MLLFSYHPFLCSPLAYSLTSPWSTVHFLFDSPHVAVQNYWIGPFTALAGGIFNRKGVVTFERNDIGLVIVYFLVSMALVIWSNLQTVYERQLAFRVGMCALCFNSPIISNSSVCLCYFCFRFCLFLIFVFLL